MPAPFRSTVSFRKPALRAALLLSTLAPLLNVTSIRPVFALQSTPAATESSIVAAEEPDDDKPDMATKGDDEDDDDTPKFLQPVRVGDLIGRSVIAPVESQDLLGHVTALVQHGDEATIVMSYGGHFGLGTHLVCVSADALALTGTALQAKDISTDDLDKLPVCDGHGDPPLSADSTIKMKLAKPAH